MSKKKREEQKQAGSPAWMTTYGDMMTLLLCFFILLYSFSVIDVDLFDEVMSALQVSFLRQEGVLDTGQRPSVVDREIEIPDVTEEPIDEFFETYETIKSYLEEYGLEEDVGIRYEKKGIVLELKEAVLFDSGRVELKPGALDLLEHVALILERVPNKIMIEGHTDNVPINRPPMFPSNWELSVIRATSVIRHLSENMGLAPGRFIAVGYSEYDPIDTNETPEGRAQNRRVNIVITDEEKEE